MRLPLFGRAIVVIVALLLLVDGLLQLSSPPVIVAALSEVGYPASAGPKIAVITFFCATLLLNSTTAPLGAILSTGFLGAAISAHFRVDGPGSPPQLLCLALGVAMWFGLWLADKRVRALLRRQGEKGAEDKAPLPDRASTPRSLRASPTHGLGNTGGKRHG